MIDDNKMSIDSFFIPPISSFIGLIIAPIPNTNRIFAMQEPTMLPSEIPGLFPIPAPTDTASSGVDVPNPMSNADMMNAGIPKYNAVFVVPSTSISDPLASNINPMINTGIANNIGSILNM